MRLLLALSLVAWFAAPSGVQGEQFVDPRDRHRQVHTVVFSDQHGAKPVQIDRGPRLRGRREQHRHRVVRVFGHGRDGMR